MKLKPNRGKHVYKAKFTEAEIKVLRKFLGDSTRNARERLGIKESEEGEVSSMWACIRDEVED